MRICVKYITCHIGSTHHSAFFTRLKKFIHFICMFYTLTVYIRYTPPTEHRQVVNGFLNKYQYRYSGLKGKTITIGYT